MRTKYKVALAAVIALFILFMLGPLLFKKRKQAFVLATEVAGYRSITESVTATGTVQPVDTIAVGTQVSGIVKAIYADFNSKIKKGQLLAQLDKSILQATVDQNRANVQTQLSQYTYNNGVFERQKLLYATGAISKQEYESALNNKNTAQAALFSAEAQLRSSLKNLSYTNIYSPVDGVVLSRSVSIGQTVAAAFSTPTLFVIAKDITKMQIQAAVDEADIGNVKLGNKVSFTVDAYIDASFNGTVSEVRLHPKTTSNVVTYTTIINAPNPDLKLKPGMTTNITIYTRSAPRALSVNAKAVNFKPDSNVKKEFVLEPLKNSARTGSPNSRTGTVWVKKGSRLREIGVALGLDDNTQVEILSGLHPGDTVVSGIKTAENTKKSSSFLPAPEGKSQR